MTAAPSIDQLDGPHAVAEWLAAGDTEGHVDEALAALTLLYGPTEAAAIWLRGSQLADQLGVW